MRPITRFAPSPTGPLHLGHAYSAQIAYDRAKAGQGQFLLRIEDIDQSRARAHWETQIFEDLRWFGLAWDGPVLRQSERLDAYRAALDKLAGFGQLYPCSCRRADILNAVSAPQEGAPRFGPDGLVYPGTCRQRPMADAQPQDTLRLNMARAWDYLGNNKLLFKENGPIHDGEHRLAKADMLSEIGDVVLSRRDMGTSYHLSVVVDDAEQRITEVTRGDDLFEATPIHVLLQNLLELPTPEYFHHALVRDTSGRRLAKRDDARSLASYRAAGFSADDLRSMLAASDNLSITPART